MKKGWGGGQTLDTQSDNSADLDTNFYIGKGANLILLDEDMVRLSDFLRTSGDSNLSRS